MVVEQLAVRSDDVVSNRRMMMRSRDETDLDGQISGGSAYGVAEYLRLGCRIPRSRR